MGRFSITRGTSLSPIKEGHLKRSFSRRLKKIPSFLQRRRGMPESKETQLQDRVRNCSSHGNSKMIRKTALLSDVRHSHRRKKRLHRNLLRRFESHSDTKSRNDSSGDNSDGDAESEDIVLDKKDKSECISENLKCEAEKTSLKRQIAKSLTRTFSQRSKAAKKHFLGKHMQLSGKSVLSGISVAMTTDKDTPLGSSGTQDLLSGETDHRTVSMCLTTGCSGQSAMLDLTNLVNLRPYDKAGKQGKRGLVKTNGGASLISSVSKRTSLPDGTCKTVNKFKSLDSQESYSAESADNEFSSEPIPWDSLIPAKYCKSSGTAKADGKTVSSADNEGAQKASLKVTKIGKKTLSDEQSAESSYQCVDSGENIWIKRSDSVNSVHSDNSFSSSVHSVKSTDLLFSSDSEEETDTLVTIPTETDHSFQAELKFLKSRDSVSDRSPIHRTVSLGSVDIVLDRSPEVESPGSVFLDHPMSIKYDQQMAVTSTPIKSPPVKGGSFESPFTKSSTKKANKRRSLDSSLSSVKVEPFKGHKLSSKTDPGKETGTDGISNTLSPVIEIGAVDTSPRHKSEANYYTLPNPRKQRSKPPTSRVRRHPTISSISKKLSEAQSLTNLKIGASIKAISMEVSDISKAGFSKTRSLSNLMSRKGIAVASSLSSFIRGRSNSSSSSTKKPSHKRRKKDEGSVLVYELSKVIVPKKLHASGRRRKSYAIDLNVAPVPIQSQFDVEDKRERKNLSSSGSSDSSVCPRSPVLLDEIMKSVDVRRLRPTCLVGSSSLVPNGALSISTDSSELGSSSPSNSSKAYLSKHHSESSDIVDMNVSRDKLFMTFCGICGKVQYSYTRNSIDLTNVGVPWKRKATSLCDLTTECACERRNFRSPLYDTQQSFQSREDLSSEDLDHVSPRSDELYKSPKRHSSMIEICMSPESTDDSVIDFRCRLGSGVEKSRKKSLLRHKPVLDLSVDDIDKAVAADKTVTTRSRKESNRSLKVRSVVSTCSGENFSEPWVDSIPRFHSQELLDDVRGECHSLTTKDSPAVDGIDGYCRNYSLPDMLSTNDFVHPDNEGRHDRDSVKGKVGDANNSFDKTSQRSDSLDLNSNEKGKQSTDKKSGFCSSCGSVLTAVEASTAENTGTHADCDTDRGHVEYAGNQGYRCCTQCQYKGKTTNGKVVPFRGRLERLATVEYDESLGFEVNTDSLNESSKSNGDLKTETGHMVTCNECQTGSLDSCDKQYDKCDKCKRTIPLTGSLELCNKQWDNCDKCKRTIPLNSVTKDGTNVGVERERPLCPECQKNVHNFKKSLPVTMVTSFCDSDEDLQKQEKRKHFSPKPSFPADAKHFLFSEHDIKALSDTNINKDHDTTGSKMEKNNVTLIQKTVCSRFSRWGSVDKLTTKVTDKPHVKFTSKTRSWSMSFRELSPFASLLQKQQKASSVSQMPRSPSYITSSAHKLKHKYTSSKSQDSLNSISEDELLHELPPLRRDLAGCGGGEMEEVLMYDVCLGYLVHSITCDNVTVCVYSLQRNKQLMEGVISPGGVPGSKPSPPPVPNKQNHQSKNKMDDLPNPAAPITVIPSEKLSRAGQVLRTILLSRAPHMIRDRKFHLRTYRRCMVGTEMVDWLLQQSSLVHSRNQAVGMWQALVEEGVIVHVCHEHQFKDKYLFYRFHEDDQGVSTVPSSVSKKECEDELQDTLLMLAQTGPDAMMRMILRKLPHERTMEDLEIIYEELLHIKALSHLSTMVKRELASVLVFESHAKAGTVLFNQGDEGKSWYIILKGSVNVVIYGKGVVCSLHEGDDFGKLALVNDAPRAATIVLRDDNCHFLRVDKEDFNRILRDVEANTVRLKEHGQDVLVLEKIPSNVQAADGTVQAHYKYSIMAGTPEKMLEHLLETRMDNKAEEESDGFLEDFLLTHVIFMPCNHLCPVLLSHYHSARSDSTEQEAHDFMLNHKRCVLHFVQEWATIVRAAFREDHTINAFLEELNSCVLEDLKTYPALKHELSMLNNILQNNDISSSDEKKKKKSVTGSSSLSRKTSKENLLDGPKKRRPIKTSDENIFKVYCADHTYSTLRLPMDSTVVQIIDSAKDKLCLGEDLVLCEVKSTGERLPFKEIDLCVTSGLSFNGRLFITPREHLDALTPLPEQEGPPSGTMATIEMVSSRDMAYYMTLYDWELFMCVQEYELIYQVFGRYKFRKITANLDLFLRRFNEVQFWVVTEMVLTTNLSKRVTLLRKFIKLAAHCKENQNLNAFFAIVMGLSNIAVSRLSLTWEKLPGKFKKMFADFETLMDPSRNHRVYRLSVAKMVPPIIPFMPLLMKDMTFTHEGNKTYFDGLVNFEKMHMIAQTLKTVRFCRSHGLDLEAPGSMKSNDIANYIRNLEVIDNQRLLTQLSHKLEPRKT